MKRLPTIPIPIPFRLYYGWVIVATGLVINSATASLNPVLYSFFITPMHEDTGWSLGALSLALTFRLVASGITAPLIGIVIDRIGPKWLGVFAGLAAGGSLIGLFFAHELWLFYLLFALSGCVGVGGGPTGNLLTMVPVAKWFRLKRGRAMSLTTAGNGMGSVIAIFVGQWIIQTMGWRQAWVVFGVAVAVVIAPLSFLFLRGSPSDLGLQPDGLPNEDHEHLSQVEHTYGNAAVETDWTAREVVRHPVCWLILAALAISGFASSGTLLHRVAYWHEIGMSPGLVAFGTVVDPFTFMVFVVIFGFLAERVKIRYLALIGGLGWSLSMLPMILSTGQTYTIFLHNIVWAITASAYMTASALIWPNYFGRKFLGSIQGIVVPVQVAASGLGPPVYGLLLDAGIAPKTLWMISAGMLAVAALLLFQARQPQRKPAGQEAFVAGHA